MEKTRWQKVKRMIFSLKRHFIICILLIDVLQNILSQIYRACPRFADLAASIYGAGLSGESVFRAF